MRKLKRDYRAIVNNAPEAVKLLLRSYATFDPADSGPYRAAFVWRNALAEEVVVSLYPKSPGMYEYEGTRQEWIDEAQACQRARRVCPFCLGSASGRPGFLAEGLRRHLVGSHDREECPVLRAATELAMDSLVRRMGRDERRKLDRRMRPLPGE
jgi:hypothetical protein